MKDIRGYNGVYKVSRDGKIFKLVGSELIEINPSVNSWGYMVFSMSLKGKRKMYKVHRVVAECYVKNKNPEKFNQINHKDRNKLNNYYSNLEWTDNKLNNEHRSATTIGVVRKPRITDLTKEMIIKERLRTGYGSCRLAKKFNVSINTVHRLIKDI